MSRFLIQGAEESEINYLKSKLENIEKIVMGGFTFFKGTYGNIEVIVSRIKVGEINSAAATTIGILEFSPDLIINQGTAGGHGKDTHKGNIVIGKECKQINAFYSEYLDEGNGYSIDNWILKEYVSDEDKLNPKEWKKAPENLLNLVEQNIKNITDKKIFSGVISSGDVWNRECDRILYLNKKYGSLCEEMEMAGVYKTASNFGVPAISIKIISNNEVLKEDYDSTIATELQEIIYKLVLEIENQKTSK